MNAIPRIPVCGTILVSIIILTACAVPRWACADERPLQLGDPAPALKVAHWLRGEPVARFESGKTYVVEFWATWCEPCKQAMPHLAALARQYKNRVPFISVNTIEKAGSELTDSAALKRVRDFVQGAGMEYTVAMDDANDAAFEAWLTAAGEIGIPKAFIVHDGKVVWIGNPPQLDEPLKQVVSGTYDLRISLAERLQKRSDDEEARLLLSYQPLLDARKAKDYDTQARIYQQALAINPRLVHVVSSDLFAALLHLDASEAIAYARALVAKQEAQAKWYTLLSFVPKLLEETRPSKSHLDLALEFAQLAVAINPNERPFTYALVAQVHFARGELKQAVAMQKLAVTEAEQTPPYDPNRKKIVQRHRGKLDEYQAKVQR